MNALVIDIVPLCDWMVLFVNWYRENVSSIYFGNPDPFTVHYIEAYQHVVFSYTFQLDIESVRVYLLQWVSVYLSKQVIVSDNQIKWVITSTGTLEDRAVNEGNKRTKYE